MRSTATPFKNVNKKVGYISCDSEGNFLKSYITVAGAGSIDDWHKVNLIKVCTLLLHFNWLAHPQVHKRCFEQLLLFRLKSLDYENYRQTDDLLKSKIWGIERDDDRGHLDFRLVTERRNYELKRSAWWHWVDLCYRLGTKNQDSNVDHSIKKSKYVFILFTCSAYIVLHILKLTNPDVYLGFGRTKSI